MIEIFTGPAIFSGNTFVNTTVSHGDQNMVTKQQIMAEKGI